ncbi:MAG: MerR family transcriptional regulator [Elusimicrobia bacterium]|nr:MerR family transcriptional regulator [Elusimicrobiota bacterium]
MDAAWALEELCAAVETELLRRGLAEAQADGRVSSVPDARTIRYYQTLGLLDRPAIVERQARYGRRQLLQLLAIKVLQASGVALSEIQERLYGASDAELDALLHSAAEKRPAPRLAARVLREVTLAPGLKLVAEEGFSARLDAATLERRVRAAIDALGGGS